MKKIDQMSNDELVAQIKAIKAARPYGQHQKTLVKLMQHQITVNLTSEVADEYNR